MDSKSKDESKWTNRSDKKSCDLVTVGKAIWKMMAVPSILYGRAVATTSKTNIKTYKELKIEYGGVSWA